MSAAIVDICEAVVLTLNGRTFAMPFVAERTYRTVLDLGTLKDLQVLVVPMGQEIGVSSRKADQFNCGVNVVVQQKLTTQAPEEIDALMDLVQEIIDCLRDSRLEGMPGVVPVSIENEPVFHDKHLVEEHVFTSVIIPTYRAWRERV